MIQPHIDQFEQKAQDCGFIEGLWMADVMPLILLFLVLITIAATVCIISYVQDLYKKTPPAYRIGTPLGLTAIFLFISTVSFIIVSAFHHDDALRKEKTLDVLRVNVLEVIAQDIVQRTDATPIPVSSITQDAVLENQHQLYEMSFIANDKRYDHKTVYMTYIEGIPSNTLIPFDGEPYTDMVITRETYQAPSGINLSPNPALRFHAYTDGTTIKSTRYIDEIDYIYNIDVQ